MIRSHISSTQKCRVVLKLERFSHISDLFFRLGSAIGLEALLVYYLKTRVYLKKNMFKYLN